MKKNILNFVRLAAVTVCTITCMVLLMAEPVSDEMNTKQWMTVFVCMKAGAIISGAVAFGLAGKLNEIVGNFRGHEDGDSNA